MLANMIGPVCTAVKELYRPDTETLLKRHSESGFRILPKRYGVTSGFIISQSVPNLEDFVHYDVIIYDQLDSPVLWVEGSPDSSLQGRSKAIPVEYVCGVIEVKAV